MGHGKSGGGSKYAEGSRVGGGAAIQPFDQGQAQQFLALYQNWVDGLSEADKQLLKDYTDQGHLGINKVARGERADNQYGDIGLKIAFLQKILMKTSIPMNTMSYRGIRSGMTEAEARQMIGKTVEEKGFMSTSLDFGQAMRFTTLPDIGSSKTRAVYQLTLPKGLPGGYLEGVTSAGREHEMLLPKNARFKITGVRFMKYNDFFPSASEEKIIIIQAKYLGA